MAYFKLPPPPVHTKIDSPEFRDWFYKLQAYLSNAISTTWASITGTPTTFAGYGIVMATNRLLGRTTAGTGTPEEISVGTGLSLSAGVLSATGGGGGAYHIDGGVANSVYTLPQHLDGGSA